MVDFSSFMSHRSNNKRVSLFSAPPPREHSSLQTQQLSTVFPGGHLKVTDI